MNEVDIVWELLKDINEQMSKSLVDVAQNLALKIGADGKFVDLGGDRHLNLGNDLGPGLGRSGCRSDRSNGLEDYLFRVRNKAYGIDRFGSIRIIQAIGPKGLENIHDSRKNGVGPSGRRIRCCETFNDG